MNSVAAVLATASLPSSVNIRLILPDGGKHHNESLKLSKGGWIWGHSAHHRAAGSAWTATHWHFPYLRAGQHAKLMSSVAVTDVTGCSRDTFIFWTGLKCKSPNAAGSDAAEVRIALG